MGKAQMKIYFAAAISGGRDRQPILRKIVGKLQDIGCEVLTEHVAREDVLAVESQFSMQEIFQRDIAWLRQSDAMVAEVTTPSLGVGYEIARAIEFGKPVLCLCEEGTRLSAMIRGNDAQNLTINEYSREDQITASINAFCKQICP